MQSESLPALPGTALLPADSEIMSPPASRSRLGAEFDAFLFGPIGQDRNGLTLSVVSLLGRMDLDPWQEAAKLAGLPVEIAAQKLATLLTALSDPSLKPADAGKMAIRLIAQLPGRPAADLGVTWSATHPCRGPSPRPDDRNLVCDLDDLGVGYARHGPA
jgi:hypothetical protein